MTPAEPVRSRFASPSARYFAATRPAFLSVTLAGALLGTAYASWAGPSLRILEASVAVLFALVAHAGINVLNDYFDAVNGSDDANVDRLYPYTGGSRMIQNAVMTRRETLALGIVLLAAVLPAGLWLAARSGAGLLLIGVAGVAIGWNYSAPPVALMARGLGELAVTGGFLLVVVGCDFVQRGALDGAVAFVGLAYALLVANVLYINQFPDLRADTEAGKRTLVVRLGARAARWGYIAIAAVAFALVVAALVRGMLPVAASGALLSAVPSAYAARALMRHAHEPARLAPAIRATIAAAVSCGVLLCVALVVSSAGGLR